jgi:hypothetical protein
MNEQEANILMNRFESRLESLIEELLLDTDITPDQINEYYGYGNDCQITKRFREVKEEQE